MVFFLSVSIVKSLDLTHEEYKRYWQEWKSFYGKSYESDILDKAHFAVWKTNLQVSRFYSSKIIGNLASILAVLVFHLLNTRETQGTE